MSGFRGQGREEGMFYDLGEGTGGKNVIALPSRRLFVA
jgi:hypothetical protein